MKLAHRWSVGLLLPVVLSLTGAADVGQRDQELEAAAQLAAESVRLTLPRALRPASVTVRVARRGDATVDGVVARPDTLTLVVGRDALPLTHSIWAHELAHLSMGTPTPDSRVEARMLRVLHEGLADAVAALATASAEVGGERELRDLRTPPPVRPESWVLLGREGFDPHPAGWALASELWREARGRPQLIEDSMAALRAYRGRAHQSPAAVLAEVARACPARSRDQLRALLARWSGLPIREVE